MSRLIQQGATDQSTTLRFLDSVTFEPQDVDHSTAGLALWYRREGGAKTAIAPAALAALTTAHTDGGVEAIDDGYSRVDVPDAAFASGAAHVEVGGTATGMICIGASHHLVPWDPQNATSLGVSRLDAAISSRSSHSAADTADAVWDEAKADHIAAGSFGASVALEASLTNYATLILTDTTSIIDDVAVVDANVDAVLLDTGTDGVVVAAASKTGYTLTSGEHTSIAAAVWAYVVENSKTAVQMLRGLWAFAITKTSGHSASQPDTVVARDDADGKARITWTVDQYGNRTAVIINDLD